MSELIFVTGASGFLGSHIVSQLLQSGYRVRATARGSKVDELKVRYSAYGDRFEAVASQDIASDQLSDALKDVYALIHTASPLAGRGSSEELLKGAIEGTLNIVRQAEQAGVKRIVSTSSIAAVMSPGGSFKDHDWFPITKEEALSTTDKMLVYRASKTLAERELWAFADAHPNIDVTTFNPPFLYGPFTEEFKLQLKSPNYSATSTNVFIHRLLNTDGPYPSSPFYADVRDVARAHVLALSAPLSTEANIGRKRLIFASPYRFEFENLGGILQEKRPQLVQRLTSTPTPSFPLAVIPYDASRLGKVLGWEKSDFKTFEETFLGAVDSLLELEETWKEQGHKVQVPNA